jgi:glycosyltransferase involved in cell wall biosynthesis
MKIAHVTPVYPPHGGMGTVAKKYANLLRDRHEDVTVFTPAYCIQSRKSHIVYLSGIFSYGNASLTPSLLYKLRGFELIHLHYPFYGGAIFTALAAFFYRIPLVVTYHMKTKADGWLGAIFRLHRFLIEPIIFSIAKVVLVSSTDYADAVGMRTKKRFELPFSVDIKRFDTGHAPEIRAQHGVSQTSFVFVFVGGLDDAHYFKGVDFLLEAASRLPVESDCNVIIVGGGNRLAYFQHRVRDMGIENRVHFSGRVSSTDLPAYYRAANIHVLPSIDRSEAFGLVTLEAAASGIPSIVSNLPGVRTLVESRKTGLYIQPGDVHSLTLAMTWALDHQDIVDRMGRQARERVSEEYAEHVCIDRLQQVYDVAKV